MEKASIPRCSPALLTKTHQLTHAAPTRESGNATSLGMESRHFASSSHRQENGRSMFWRFSSVGERLVTNRGPLNYPSTRLVMELSPYVLAFFEPDDLADALKATRPPRPWGPEPSLARVALRHVPIVFPSDRERGRCIADPAALRLSCRPAIFVLIEVGSRARAGELPRQPWDDLDFDADQDEPFAT